jgi:hypothetical protein
MNKLACFAVLAAVTAHASAASAQDAPAEVPTQPAPPASAAPAQPAAPLATAPTLPPAEVPGTGAEPYPGDDRDGGRFRGAIAGTAGALVYPDAGLALGVTGVQGEIGGQINDLVGIVFIPGLGIVFGKQGGLYASAAALVDFTIDDLISLGVGPEATAFLAVGANGDGSGGSASGGGLVGGRLHFAVHPALGYGQNGIRRKALSIGVDLRFLRGPAAAVEFGENGGGTGSVNAFIFSPMASIGYTAF